MVEQPFSNDPTQDLDSKQRIGVLRSRFEKSWQTEQRLNIEDLLDEMHTSERRELFLALLTLELELRRRDGDTPDGTDYENRFPEFRDVVRDVFKEKQGQDFSTSRWSITETMSRSQKPQQTTDVLTHGQTIGRFVVQKVLGVGGFGTVYLAHDVELDREVAIKCPRTERFDSVEKLEQFVGEARTVAKLKHSGIVAIYDVARQSDGSPFVVMEFIDGRSLKELVDAEQLPLQQAAELMSQIADAVSFAHKNGYVHRDLKPANILLDGVGKPHVADFGLAVHEDEQRHRRGEVSGTLSYMSPEQVRGDVHHIDGRSDIWSLGVILYEMLTGRLPFSGDSFDEISDEILHREPRPPRQMDDSIPDDLEAIINRCCAKEIKDRYSTASDLANDLRQLLVDSTPPTDRSGSTESQVLAKPQLRTGIKIGNLGCVVSISFAMVLIACGIVVLPKLLDNVTPSAQVADRSSPKSEVDKRGEVDDPQPAAGEVRMLRSNPRRSGGPVVTRSRINVQGDSVELMLSQPDNETRRWLNLHYSSGRPVKAEDRVHVEARLDEAAYIYMLWIDSAGALLPLYPWQPGDWNSRPSDESPTDQISLPTSAIEPLPLSPEPGMETLIMLVRQSPLEADVDLLKTLGTLPRQTAQQAGSRIEFVNGQIVTELQYPGRGPKRFDPSKIDDPVLTTQRLVQDKLAEQFSFIHSISFANQGVRMASDHEQLRKLLRQVLVEITPRKQVYSNSIKEYLANPTEQSWSNLRQDAQANIQQLDETVELLGKVEGEFVADQLKTFRQLALDLQKKLALYRRLLNMDVPKSEQEIESLRALAKNYESLLRNLSKHEDAMLNYLRDAD